MRKIFTAAIGLLFILFYCSSCSTSYRANRQLRIAERHIKKAEALGAKWSRDSLFKKMSFTIPGVDVKFIPKPIIYNQEMTFEKDSAKTTVLIRHVPGSKDTLYVHTIVNPRVVTKYVPYKVENTIKADKPSFWKQAERFTLIAIIFFAMGYFARDGPVKWLTTRFDKLRRPFG